MLQVSSSATPSEEKEKFVWRMHQPSEARKYQLFPSKDRVSVAAGRNSPDADQASINSTSGTDRTLHNFKLKAKELAWRRKPSVTDLGPMTTVQELAMDSRRLSEILVHAHN